MSKHITIIINPGAGKQDSILWSINNAFQHKDFMWNIVVTQKKGDGYTFAKEAIEKNIRIVAVYGGDGTISEVARALVGSKTALFIIPGGTANVFAKELAMPIDVDQSLALLTKQNHKRRTIDVGLLNKEPFVLRIEAGLSAHIVKSTKRSSKRIFGLLSYLLHGFKKMQQQKIYTFQLDLDGEKIVAKGTAIVIANIGNIGITGYSVLPHMILDDGYLDVIVIKRVTPSSALSWAINTLSRKRPHDEIRNWKIKKVTLTFPTEQTIICDDAAMRKKKITAEVLPKSLEVIVP